MSTKHIEALKLALEGAANYIDALGGDSRKYRQALAEQPAPVQGWRMVPIEPTEDMWKAVNKLDDEMAAGSYDGKGCSIEQAWNCLLNAAPTTPAQRKPLTDEQAYKAIKDWTGDIDPEDEPSALDIFRAAEAAHGIKEQL